MTRKPSWAGSMWCRSGSFSDKARGQASLVVVIAPAGGKAVLGDEKRFWVLGYEFWVLGYEFWVLS